MKKLSQKPDLRLKGDLSRMKDPVSPLTSHPWQLPSLEELRSLLPGFAFESLIGRGGMGAVYRARQLSVGRTVAVKILPDEWMKEAGGVMLERFEGEARILAKLAHPGIVRLFEFASTLSGMSYMVMEHVEGTDLGKLVQGKGRLEGDRAADLAQQICRALHYAHGQGVIHRDIKPSNILISSDGTAKIADFGLARPLEAAARHLTRTCLTVGSPDFLAPEAWRDGTVPDQRSDLYSVGVVLYQMLKGDVPRGRWKAVSVDSGLDPRFDAIISKAMEAVPASRYQNASDLQSDLEVLRTTPAGTVLPVAGCCRRRQLSRWVAAAAGLAVLGGLVFFRPAVPARGPAPIKASTLVTVPEGDGPGSLLAAMQYAATTPGPDTIRFDPSLAGKEITRPHNEHSYSFTDEGGLTVDASDLPDGVVIKWVSRIVVQKTYALTLKNLTFTAGKADYGAVLMNDGEVTLMDCRFTGNTAKVNGGALGNNGTMTLVRCSLWNNTAGTRGGAIKNMGLMSLTDCTLANNHCGDTGGAISNDGDLNLLRCTFTSNEAQRGGGAIMASGGTITATHCTFSLNQSLGTTPATQGGGALMLGEGVQLKLDACIVAGNTSASGIGPDLWPADGQVSAVRSLIGNARDTSFLQGQDDNLTGTPTSPLDPGLSPLGAFGRTPPVMVPLPGSPALDKATGSAARQDQRGVAIQGIPDIGAAESPVPAALDK